MDESSKPSPRGDATREALLEAATQVFARDAFSSANLRDIAGLARVNPALIGYHFRNKEGLYLAVFERMVEQLRTSIGPALAGMRAALDADPAAPDARQRGLEAILRFLEDMLLHILQENPAWGELFVRELMNPSAAFEVLHDGVMQHGLGGVIGLLARLRPQDSPETLRLLAGSLITQVAVIRISRAPLLRLMGWRDIGDAERAAMRALIRRNTTLIVLGA
jgi:AcrR family transcriptional regulator